MAIPDPTFSPSLEMEVNAQSARTSRAILAERRRLARELHDSVSQSLYGISLGARTARRALHAEVGAHPDDGPVVEAVDYILQLAETALREMKTVIYDLHPIGPGEKGLVAALREQVAALSARHHLAVDTSLCDEPGAPATTKAAVYRVAREALHNVVKHARAERVALHLARDERGILLEVADDGVGFDPQGSFPGHLGLRSMRERVGQLSGSLEIRSAPGCGTRIRARFPC